MRDKRGPWAYALLDREGLDAAKNRDLQLELVRKYEEQTDAARTNEAVECATENLAHAQERLWHHRQRLAAVNLLRNLLDAYGRQSN